MNRGFLDMRWPYGFRYKVNYISSTDTELGIGIFFQYFHLSDCLSRSAIIYIRLGNRKYGCFFSRQPNYPRQ